MWNIDTKSAHHSDSEKLQQFFLVLRTGFEPLALVMESIGSRGQRSIRLVGYVCYLFGGLFNNVSILSKFAFTVNFDIHIYTLWINSIMIAMIINLNQALKGI